MEFRTEDLSVTGFERRRSDPRDNPSWLEARLLTIVELSEFWRLGEVIKFSRGARVPPFSFLCQLKSE